MLSNFPELEIFRGDAIWIAVQLDKDKMHKVIMELVQKCPKLRQLDHCDYDDGREDWKIIQIIREGEEGEKVRYEIRKPLLRCVYCSPFETLFLTIVMQINVRSCWTRLCFIF